MIDLFKSNKDLDIYKNVMEPGNRFELIFINIIIH